MPGDGFRSPPVDGSVTGLGIRPNFIATGIGMGQVWRRQSLPLSRGRTWYEIDLVAIIDSFDAMYNAHDLDAVLQIFTEDVTVVIKHREADRPRVFTGIVEIREMLKLWL